MDLRQGLARCGQRSWACQVRGRKDLLQQLGVARPARSRTIRRSCHCCRPFGEPGRRAGSARRLLFVLGQRLDLRMGHLPHQPVALRLAGDHHLLAQGEPLAHERLVEPHAAQVAARAQTSTPSSERPTPVLRSSTSSTLPRTLSAAMPACSFHGRGGRGGGGRSIGPGIRGYPGRGLALPPNCGSGPG